MRSTTFDAARTSSLPAPESSLPKSVRSTSFFTPVATRLRTYAVDLSAFGDDGAAAAYADRLLREPEFLEWEAQA